MKRFALLLFIALFALAGCAITAPQIPKDLCSQFDSSKSFLLKTADTVNMPLNEVYYGLLDATTLAMVGGAVDRVRVKAFMVEVGKWYDEHYPVSYTTLINYMTNKEQAALLSGIVMRRIGSFKSFLIISKYDDCLLRAGWADAMDQLMLSQ